MSATTLESPPKALNVSLWIAQALLAAVYLMAGAAKATTPIAELAAQMSWVSQSPEWLVRAIGAAEIAGAAGLLLPAALRIAPILTPVAAAGLAVVQVLAFALHASKGETAILPANVVLFGIAAFIAWGRLRRAPIRPR